MTKAKPKRNLDLAVISITALTIVISLANVAILQGMATPSAPAAVSTNSQNGKAPVAKPSTPVDVTILADPSCSSCINASALTLYLQQSFGVNITRENVLDYTSAQAQGLINKYNITSVPAFIASAGMASYGNMSRLWPQLGTVEQDGSYVLRAEIPPYRSLSDGKIKGLVKLSNIVDGSCKECYDISLQKIPLSRLGIFIANESTYDVSSEQGKAYVKGLNITKVPTIVLSPDAKYYANLNGVWAEVGTVENDGTYVFRNLDALGGIVYKDLVTEKIIGLNATVTENSTAGNVTANGTANPGNVTANGTNSSG